MSDENEQKVREEQSRRYYGPNLEKKHTEACAVLPDRLALISAMPQGGVWAEIGVAFGDFSREIIQYAKPRQLYLIDLWQSERYIDGISEVERTLGNEIRSGQVKIERGLSLEVIPKLPDNYFDFMYIDTVHDYDTTLSELRLCVDKIKPSGFLAGHDFSTGNCVKPLVYGVIQACNRFCRENDWRYRFITLETGTSFSFCLERMPT